MKRWLIFGAIALLSIIAVFYVLRKPSGGPDGGLPELAQYVPAAATSIVYVDVSRFRESQFIARVQAMLPDVQQDPEYKEFVAATGFDYARDLHRIVVAFSSAAGAPNTLAFAEGNFDRERLAKYAQTNGRVERAQGVDVHFASKEPRSPRFVFLSGERVAVAEADANAADYLAALVNASGHSGPSKELRERVARVSAAPFFAAGRAEDLTGRLLENQAASGNTFVDQARAILKNVRWYGIAAQPEGEAMRVAVEAECDNVLRAGQLSVLLDSARFLARAALRDPKTRRQYPAGQIALLEELLTSAQISRDQQRVRVMFAISASALK